MKVHKRFRFASWDEDRSIPRILVAALKTGKKKRNRAATLRIVWVLLVVVSLMVTAAALFVSYLAFGTCLPGIFVATPFWAALFAIAILFFLPSKWVRGALCSILGIGASHIWSGSSLLSDCDKALGGMAQQIAFIAGTKTLDTTVHSLLWIFLIVVLLICLPAFFTD